MDTTPDLRQQALTHGMTRLDAVLFTHSHADHILGLDEIRRFNFMQGAAIPCYATDEVWESIRRTFYYVFDGVARQGGGIPKIDAHGIDGPFDVAGMHVVPVPLFHGRMPILGFRFGDFAYLTDCSAIPEESWPLVAGVRDAGHRRAARQEALDALHGGRGGRGDRAALRRRAPTSPTCRTTWVTPRPTRACPAGVELAYDGLSLDARVDAS